MKKNLFFQLTYNQVAKNETFSYCHEPLVRKCDGEAAKRTVCADFPETFCTTKYIEDTERGNGNYIGDTNCERIQTQVCVPVNCAMVPGEPECHNKVKAVFQEVPEEVSEHM